jgi:glycerate 2-kinase
MEYKRNKDSISEIFYAALKAVNSYESVKLYTNKILSTYSSYNCNRVIVTGFGKAACQMTKATEDPLKDLTTTGTVITKYGHCPSSYRSENVRVIEAGHPVPDENGLKGTEEIMGLLKNSDENTLVVCLISGGGSALLVAPYEGVTLEEKQKITQQLLKAGASINELNTVRKHISGVKGGRLAEIAYPARILSLILSDVIGDRLDVIASGPTSPDETTYYDALKVLKKYKLIEGSPLSVLEILSKGIKGLIPETPKDGNRMFEHVENVIVGSNKTLLNAAMEKEAEGSGFEVEIISSEISGEAKDVGKWLAQKSITLKASRNQKIKKSKCLISGGETTVTVKGNGVGGRNMELALSFAIEINGVDGITLLSAGTDGTDGPTDAAGAIVDGQTVSKAKAIGIDPEAYLRNNDSYNFFRKTDELFNTGPTGTNVMDIQIVRIE